MVSKVPGAATPALDPTVKLGDDLTDDVRNFVYECLFHVLGARPTDLQYDMARWVAGEAAPGDLLRILMAFRGASKSWLTAFVAAWWIYRDWIISDGRPDLNLLIVSGTKDRADGFSVFSKDLFACVPCLRPLIPRDPRRWSSIAFDVEGAKPSQTPTCTSRALFGRTTGDRADAIVVDDGEIPQNAETQGQRDKVMRHLGGLQDVLKPGGHMVVLGTPHTEDSAYNKLVDWGYKRRIYPAEYPSPSKVPDYSGDLAPIISGPLREDPGIAGRPTEPSRFDETTLEERKARGRVTYAMQYMLDTRLGDEDRYPLKLRDLIVVDAAPQAVPEHPIWTANPQYQRKDLPNVGLPGDRFQAPSTVAGQYSRPDECIIYIDPSGRGTNETAWGALAALGGLLCLLETGSDARGYEGPVLDSIAECVRRNGAQKVIYEDNFGDGMFGSVLQGHFSRLPDMPPIGIEGVRSSGRKESRIISTLEPVMSAHRLMVAASVVENDKPASHAGPDTANRYRLFHQMTRIQDVAGALDVDDRIDALAIGVRYFINRIMLGQEEAIRKRREQEDEEALRQFWEDIGYTFPVHRAAENAGMRAHDVQ